MRLLILVRLTVAMINRLQNTGNILRHNIGRNHISGGIENIQILESGKAAGILCELVRNRAHRLHAVVGIGVNMCLGKIGVPTTDVPAAAVLVQLPDVRKLEELRIRTAACLSSTIERVCRCFSPALLTELQARWN